MCQALKHLERYNCLLERNLGSKIYFGGPRAKVHCLGASNCSCGLNNGQIGMGQSDHRQMLYEACCSPESIQGLWLLPSIKRGTGRSPISMGGTASAKVPACSQATKRRFAREIRGKKSGIGIHPATRRQELRGCAGSSRLSDLGSGKGHERSYAYETIYETH